MTQFAQEYTRRELKKDVYGFLKEKGVPSDSLLYPSSISNSQNSIQDAWQKRNQEKQRQKTEQETEAGNGNPPLGRFGVLDDIIQSNS